MDDLDIGCRTVRFVPIWRTAFTARHQASYSPIHRGLRIYVGSSGITSRDPVTTGRCKFPMARSTP